VKFNKKARKKDQKKKRPYYMGPPIIL